MIVKEVRMTIGTVPIGVTYRLVDQVNCYDGVCEYRVVSRIGDTSKVAAVKRCRRHAPDSLPEFNVQVSDSNSKIELTDPLAQTLNSHFGEP